ncbi:tetratricopeptide repeat protein [Cyanobium sp. NS01]|uniref:tetratricopeptide repeat protein n=1 Tax=Cyanobium sp. NS01 TaxID=261284 RepID=UPI00164704AB|nr:tetratricopeptide repeat protein [Cyanobium sp. NS01]
MQDLREPEPGGTFAAQLAALVRSETLARSADDWLALAEGYAAAQILAPQDHRLAANRGNALWIADRPMQALAAYQRAVQLAPDDPVVYRGLANVHCDRQAFEAADRAYARSRGLAAEAITAWNHSQLLIGLERYAEGYALAESRWELAGLQPWRDPTTAWRGEPQGWQGPLLLWSEQGLGDTLQHLRWLGPLVQRRGEAAPPLVLEVEPCLVELLRQGLAHLEPRPVVRGKTGGDAPTWRGAQVSLLSLPGLLGGAPLPKAAAWLQAVSWAQPRELGRQGQQGLQPLRVGLVWAAGRKLDDPVTAREYRRRSLSPEALGALILGLEGLGARCTLLQFGPDRHQADPFRAPGTEELAAEADFAATAALVAQLDLVISVDTAMAHLVGAMGRRGWLLLPFSAAPRWLRHRADTPWYPSLRLFRQPQPGDWQAVVWEVLTALRDRGADLGAEVELKAGCS